MKKLSLVPAYGRDYKSKKEIEGSLVGNLDFQISDISSPDDGKYINLPQIEEAGFTHLNVRYAKLTKVHVVEVKKLEKPKPSFGDVAADLASTREKASLTMSDGRNAVDAEIGKKAVGFYVQIIEKATKKVEKEMGPMTAAKAEKVSVGASINLDHENYIVDVVEVKT